MKTIMYRWQEVCWRNEVRRNETQTRRNREKVVLGGEFVFRDDIRESTLVGAPIANAATHLRHMQRDIRFSLIHAGHRSQFSRTTFYAGSPVRRLGIMLSRRQQTEDPKPEPPVFHLRAKADRLSRLRVALEDAALAESFERNLVLLGDAINTIAAEDLHWLERNGILRSSTRIWNDTVEPDDDWDYYRCDECGHDYDECDCY